MRLVPLVIACAITHAALAQTQPRVPLPGQVEREFKPPPAPPAPSRALPEFPVLPPVPPRLPDARLFARDIVIEGSTVYTPANFAPYIAPFLGREITLEDIYRLAADLTAKYVADGYFLSRVLVPAQEIADGRVRLTAVEGYIAEVKFQSARPDQEAALRRYADRIRAARPITTATLERYLLLMNDLAGVEARSTLVASNAGLGASELVVDFSSTLATGQIGGDNRGSRAFGPWRTFASGDLNSLFGRFDKTRLFGSSTLNGEQDYGSLSHTQPIGAEGGRIVATAWGARARPDPATQGISSQNRSWSAALAYLYPLVRTRTLNVTPRVGFAAEAGRADVNAMPATEDRLRIARGGVALDMNDRFRGSNIVDAELAQGLNALGARRTSDVAAPVTTGRSDFTKLTLYVARRQPLDANWTVFVAAAGQYAFNAIPSLEQFGFGGEYFGRGYDPSELIGDSGASAKVELGRELGTVGSTDAMLAGYSFYDFGTVYRRTPLVGQPAHESAASAGVGLRIRLGTSLYAYVELAKPLTRTVALEGNKDPRAYAGLFFSF